MNDVAARVCSGWDQKLARDESPSPGATPGLAITEVKVMDQDIFFVVWILLAFATGVCWGYVARGLGREGLRQLIRGE